MTDLDSDHQPKGDPALFGADTSKLEWMMAAAGALIAVAIVGLLLANALTSAPSPAAFRVDVTDINHQAAVHVVVVEVTNTGGTNVSGVVVEGEVVVADQPPVTAQVVLDHLPIGAARTVGLVFPVDPGEGDLEVRVLGFHD